MCRPWKPGVSLPGAVVSTVTVAKPPANSMSAVATVVPSASFQLGGQLLAAGGSALDPRPCPPSTPGDADGDGEPVQTDGVVPG